MVFFAIDALLSIGMASFMLNRLYVLFTKRQINVKGIIYSREQQPIYYWFWVAAVTFGLFAGLWNLYISIELFTGRNPFV